MKQLYFFSEDGSVYFNTPFIKDYKTLGVEVPEGKVLVSIDTTQDSPVPIFEDLPVDETKSRLDALELAMANMMGGM